MDFTKFTLNCSILYGSLPVREALSRATAAGFIDVEFWWPFTAAAPDDDEITAFLQAIADSGVRLKGMNLFAGNTAGGDRVLSWPGREAELRSSVAVARQVADATGCAIFNALYGRRQPTVTPAEQDDLALVNLASAAIALSRSGGTVVLEAISGVPDYPLRTADDVVQVLDVGADILSRQRRAPPRRLPPQRQRRRCRARYRGACRSDQPRPTRRRPRLWAAWNRNAALHEMARPARGDGLQRWNRVGVFQSRGRPVRRQ